MRVHIIVQLDGWILEKQAREIEKRLDYITVSNKPTVEADINYYMSYAFLMDKSRFDMCFFTAYQPDHPTLAKLWIQSAQQCDLAITGASRYAKKLKEIGVERVEIIVPGFDKRLFFPILKIGIIGKTDPITDRKNIGFVKKLMEKVPSDVEFVFAGSGWPGKCKMRPYEKMPNFYRSVDVVFIPSKIECCPMPVLEALACGVPVIAPDIGNIRMYEHTKYKVSDIESALQAIEQYRQIKVSRYRKIKHLTWENWAKKHDEIFKEVVEGGEKR